MAGSSRQTSAGKWLLLAYKVQREPSANRVYVWRQMKQLGAILLQDAVWVLPETPRTREQFQWLAAEISELGGEITRIAIMIDELKPMLSGDEMLMRFVRMMHDDREMIGMLIEGYRQSADQTAE